MTQPQSDDPSGLPSDRQQRTRQQWSEEPWSETSWGEPQWGEEGYAPDRATSPLAVAAFALSFFCFPVSMGLAILALRTIKRSDQRGRGLAIGALAVDGMAILLVSVLAVLEVHGRPTALA